MTNTNEITNKKLLSVEQGKGIVGVNTIELQKCGSFLCFFTM